MIVPVKVQLKGEKEPEQHLALVFEDARIPEDLISYRNALTTACKAILTNEDGNFFTDEVFWMLQLAEFISSSLDDEMERRRKPVDVYRRHIAQANDMTFREVLDNLNSDSHEQQ